MVYTDYETLERVPKKSAGWYSRVIRENAVEV
jgi:beta-glucosidase/6-phospho-beta-glucosidase/beta-galactosidase